MSDPVSVTAAYAIVLGGLAVYVASIVRRVRAAQRSAEALERERSREAPDGPAAAMPHGVPPVERRG